tara:strand:+ start:3929 stop:6721 length:2793 start_codon:yes stop_codon:yes gene_type:complete
MAAPGKEIELLTGGTEQDDKRRVGWAQNLWNIRGTVSVRPGWGQVAELDTTLGLDIKQYSAGAANFEAVEYGYTKLLGAQYIKTSFGHEQIISIFLAKCNSGNTFGESKPYRWDFYIVARIFDLTTRRHWEEVFHEHTSERAISGQFASPLILTITPSLPSTWQGCYESAYDLDNSSFIPGKSDPEWFFQVYQDNLYFGAPSLGVYMYQPVDFKDLRYQQVETSEEFDWSSGYSESPIIKRLHFTPGIYRDGFVYAESSGLSRIRATCIFRDRLAYATDHEVFFSDPGRPSNVIAVNFIQCPSANKIEAIAELRGNLLIFTSRETYLYIPSEGTIVSRGRPPVNVSSNIGCVGPSAITHADNKLLWVSHTGIYSTSDGTSIIEVSSNIRSFWKVGGLMTNPMTSYFETASNGHVDISSVTPPRTLLQFEPEMVTLAYNEGKKALIMSCPHLNGSWCLTSNMWSWWPYESIADEDIAAGAPRVNTVQNLINPWVVSSDTDFFTVCGINRDIMENDALMHLDGNFTGLASNSLGSNFVITKLGYGGSLDRSCMTEDQRLGSSKYIAVTKGGLPLTSRFYFRPLELEESASGDIYWAPIELVPQTPQAAWTGNVVAYTMTFKFDSSVWSCNSNPATALITPRIPNERIKSASGFTLVAETNNVGVATPGGGHITVTWSGAAVPLLTYVNQPSLNLTPRNPNPLIALPFTPLTTTKTQSGLGIFMISNSVTDSGGNTDSAVATLAWCGMVVGTNNKHTSNAKVQAVDWAYKSKQISTPGIQMRARGIYARMQSTGIGSTLIVPTWVWGIYNILLGSDNKGYTTQIVDYNDDITKIENKLTIRSRFQNVTGNMVGRLFGTSAADTPKWGNSAAAGEGDYLIDDGQTDTIAVSDSVKGETISYMVFGFIRNRASSLSIESLRGVFRRAGGRRRTGR